MPFQAYASCGSGPRNISDLRLIFAIFKRPIGDCIPLKTPLVRRNRGILIFGLIGEFGLGALSTTAIIRLR